MNGENLRVLVVDDTVTYRKIVADVLARIPGVEVVAAASNGRLALQKVEILRPDVLTLDVEMPEMDGLEVLRRLKTMPEAPGAIMLSAFTAAGAKATVEALSLGAFDFVLKPAGESIDDSTATLIRELRPRIEAFAKTRSIRTILAHKTAPVHAAAAPLVRPAAPERPTAGIAQRMAQIVMGPRGRPHVVALGISTGGPPALTAMMPRLPADLGVPVLIVQHMPPIFTKSLADSLNDKCALSVCEAQDGQPVRPNEALIAPGGRQMKVKMEDGVAVVRITDDPPENSCRPSVDYLFRSVAHTYGGNAVGVIMTGMGNDGALGCRLMKRCGASIVAQDAASCVVFGMPRMPIEEGIADVVAPLDRMAGEIARLVKEGPAACR